jgi:hypothetical protein
MGKAELERAWAAALEDAGFAGGEVLLLGIPGAPDDPWQEGAKWFVPNGELFSEGGLPLDRGQLERANSERARGGHRIAAWLGVEEVPLAARLRHELEHARQWDALGEGFYWFDCRMRAAVGSVFGSSEPGKRRGSARIYNLFPSEVEANAAAVEFVLREYGEAAVAEWRGSPGHGELFGSSGRPSPFVELPRETLCFAALCPREFEGEVGDRLDECLRMAGDSERAVWRRLCHDDQVQGHGRAARQAIPSEAEIAACGDRPWEAWDVPVEQLIMGFARAMKVAAD